jgi:hypothetical protein
MPWYRMVAKVQVIVVSPLWFRSVIMATMLSTKLMAFPLIASSVACLMVLLHYCIFAPGVLFTMSVNWIHCVCGVGLHSLCSMCTSKWDFYIHCFMEWVLTKPYAVRCSMGFPISGIVIFNGMYMLCGFYSVFL